MSININNFCHCGKCKIECNLHGKIDVCQVCGKVDMLGSIVEEGKIIHACEACLDEYSKQQEDKKINKVLREEDAVDDKKD